MEQERKTEDDYAREKLGPQGVPAKPVRDNMTPQQKEQTPKSGEFDGHVA